MFTTQTWSRGHTNMVTQSHTHGHAVTQTWSRGAYQGLQGEDGADVAHLARDAQGQGHVQRLERLHHRNLLQWCKPSRA